MKFGHIKAEHVNTYTHTHTHNHVIGCLVGKRLNYLEREISYKNKATENIEIVCNVMAANSMNYDVCLNHKQFISSVTQVLNVHQGMPY